ncbi:hypothetical protein [Parapoynx stagnalis nucleopolyhedrovirus]|uniref:RING-type domain-containing protein n=1 Tax=Parapoynx stagnalis nucleopolyhedrovirus TaxID=2993413 RepID=A0A9E7Y5V7_9ABAC|nr:hypothetical protein [Parapoynx stagnalis nucleopolyhedrovirus]
MNSVHVDNHFKNTALKVLTRSPPQCYDIHVNKHGCTEFTIRRYNRRIIDFARMRSRMLEMIVRNRHLPLNTKCTVTPVHSVCMRCKRSLTIFAAVTYLHCGHSCICTDCDEVYNTDNTCLKCRSFVTYKLKYKKL